MEVILFLLFLKEGTKIKKGRDLGKKKSKNGKKNKIKEEEKRWGNPEEKERGKR